MGYTSPDPYVDDPPPDAVAVASGSSFEVLCGVFGIAIIVFGILGDYPHFVGATATVVIGFGVFAQAGTIAARSSRCSERDELLGIAADLVAGIAGIVVGALVVLQVVPDGFLPIATMALGCGLIFAARVALGTEASSRNVGAQPVMLVAGISAMVLALFAFAVVAPATTLSLVAVACVGVGLVLTGGGNLTTHRISRDG